MGQFLKLLMEWKRLYSVERSNGFGRWKSLVEAYADAKWCMSARSEYEDR